ncbi:MAG: LTA synthase family protein [Lawsonibacter sp.]|jgi:phosphoglycerol transferase|nr:LTA synthase family protein [Lawsonibacter sp.]
MSRTKSERPAGMRLGLALACVVFSVSCVLWGVSVWLGRTFNINFQEILYTMTSPLVGTDAGVALKCLRACLPHICLAALFVLTAAALVVLQRRFTAALSFQFRGRRRQADLFLLARRSMAVISVLALCWAFRALYVNLRVGQYIELRRNPTTIYEDRYVDPASVSITAPDRKKNLIYLCLESMETSYASEEAGGRQPEHNYIPNLTALAQENLSFSNSDRLGGFRAVSGTTWTMGAIFAATSGLPFSFPVGENAMNRHSEFASGCTTLGDILEENGYRSMFLCGSDATFGGRRLYYQQHGNYEICDLLTAREEGYIPEDYKVWWGYEDAILYQIAKDKLTVLAGSGQPFSFTMLTVDTHHVDGYVCPLCRDDYDSVTGNVVSCADRQAADFIRWCEEQDFYDNSVIVITGDHPRMDTSLVDGLDYRDRTVYNCFLNCEAPARAVNREFTAVDLFPTVLSALGFEIEGDQLGFGVDLFSGSDTLSEVMGFQALDEEFAKYSPFVEEHLS